MAYKISPEQWAKFMEEGFFIARGLISGDVEVLVDRIPHLFKRGKDLDIRMDDARADGAEFEGERRYRKLAQFGHRDRPIWEKFYAHENVISIVKAFLGDDVRQWFDSLFTKPARVGESTPWHQDIGLWVRNRALQDRKAFVREALSIWVALTPSTVENGCLQVVPGSHRSEVIEHVKYDDSVHVELPRELLNGKEKVHIELKPGGAIVWHAHLWHYSPPNSSDKKRWGIASVTLRDEEARVILPNLRHLVKGGQTVSFDEVREFNLTP